jgi:hypothetical protein
MNRGSKVVRKRRDTACLHMQPDIQLRQGRMGINFQVMRREGADLAPHAYLPKPSCLDFALTSSFLKGLRRGNERSGII